MDVTRLANQANGDAGAFVQALRSEARAQTLDALQDAALCVLAQQVRDALGEMIAENAVEVRKFEAAHAEAVNKVEAVEAEADELFKEIRARVNAQAGQEAKKAFLVEHQRPARAAVEQARQELRQRTIRRAELGRYVRALDELEEPDVGLLRRALREAWAVSEV